MPILGAKFLDPALDPYSVTHIFFHFHVGLKIATGRFSEKERAKLKRNWTSFLKVSLSIHKSKSAFVHIFNFLFKFTFDSKIKKKVKTFC